MHKKTPLSVLTFPIWQQKSNIVGTQRSDSKRQSDFSILRGFFFHETRESKTLAKISEFTVVPVHKIP